MRWIRNAGAVLLAVGAWAGPASGILRGATGSGVTPVDLLPLPALRISGEPARAHTQGLEIVGNRYLVTARREDGAQRRALLLQWTAGDSNWSSWDLTPPSTPILDHPGGMQSDEQRLWIPISESRRKGRSVVRAYSLHGWTPDRIPAPEIEFSVDDHIGAVAVLAGRSLLAGASWDTETVYLWDFSGTEKEILRGAALSRLGLGPGTREAPGLRVQDWKGIAGGLLASGLVPTGGASTPSISRVLLLGDSLSSPPILLSLPSVAGVELGREAMAVHDGRLWFLPEDLGETNRLIRIPMPKAP